MFVFLKNGSKTLHGIRTQHDIIRITTAQDTLHDTPMSRKITTLYTTHLLSWCVNTPKVKVGHFHALKSKVGQSELGSCETGSMYMSLIQHFKFTVT